MSRTGVLGTRRPSEPLVALISIVAPGTACNGGRPVGGHVHVRIRHSQTVALSMVGGAPAGIACELSSWLGLVVEVRHLKASIYDFLLPQVPTANDSLPADSSYSLFVTHRRAYSHHFTRLGPSLRFSTSSESYN